MNPVISTLDLSFDGRETIPSTCISIDHSEHSLVQDNDISGVCMFVSPSNFAEEEIKRSFFAINNTNRKPIHLWAIDGCFMGPADTIRCDCSLFTESEFCFVEFKLNASTSTPSGIKKNRRKAYKQLKATINLLFNALTLKNLTFGNVIFEAYICTPPVWPSKDTSLDSERIEFLEHYGVSLFEKNNKQFT